MKRIGSVIPGAGRRVPRPRKEPQPQNYPPLEQQPRDLHCKHEKRVVVCGDCGEYLGDFEEG